tara:strand:- start:48 stop:1451 length:1404 start_codon:yes stop_codon:yes gene_type:complete
MEIATRMTETDMLMSTGKFATRSDANLESLRRINYYRRGKIMRHLDYAIPFANAAAQYLASNLSELKTAKGAMRATAVMAQISAGLALHRYFAEQDHPEFMKDIPWENRMRYWIIPTSMSTLNHRTGEKENVYIKIKKNYNPIFGLIDMVTTLGMDRWLYGADYEQPLDTWQMMYDTLRVSTPVELQNVVPPATELAFIYGGNVSSDFYKVYRGEPRRAEHEINTGLMGGRETKANAIAIGEFLNTSPARLQASYDAYFAANPFLHMVGSNLFEDETGASTTLQQTALDESLKTMQGSGLSIFGKTNKRWAAYERGERLVKEGNSREYLEIDRNVAKHITDFMLGKTNFVTMQRRSLKAVGNDNYNRMEIINRMGRHRDADILFRKFRTRYGDAEVYTWLGNFPWWDKLLQIKDANLQADFYFERWEETPEEWKPRLKQLATLYGPMKDPRVYNEVRRLQNKYKNRR